jgi:hypothetical protein
MTLAEAVTRPDAWTPMPWRGKWRVGRVMDPSGSIMWHVGRSIRVGGPGRAILFTIRDHAEARAGALNLADAEASR